MTIFDKAEQWLDKQIDLIKSYMNQIIINKESFDVEGKNIVVKKNKVIVNGKVIKDNLDGTVEIVFKGDLATLDCTKAEIHGNVQGNVDGTNIRCGDVGGDVDGTSVNCGNVQGDVDAMTVRKK